MPDWKSLVRRRLAPLRLAPQAESDLTDEIAQHLHDSYAESRSGGASHEEAYRKSISELDDMQPLREGLERNQTMPKYDPPPAGDVTRRSFWGDLLRDLRYAFRAMCASPMFVLFVVLTLGFGIGANTTVFTVINTLILNPLPVRNPSELVAVSAADTAGAAKPYPISYADLKDFETGNAVFQSLAGYTSPRVLTLQSAGASERMFAEMVTGNYFSTLGFAPARGRFFLPDEDTGAGAHPVVVINHATWKTRFGAAEDIIGRTLVINHVAFTVVGVAPAGFIGLNAIFGPDLWIPAAMAESLLPREMQSVTRDRSKALFTGVGRLNAGARLAQAQANLGGLVSALAREYPSTHAGHTAVVRPVRDVIFGVVGSAAGGAGPIVSASGALLAVVGIVLLIACSNVANLLLARSAARQTELAVRLAMGASRPRLVRQLLTESLLLGLLSGVLGVLLGYLGLQLLFGALPGAANFATPKLDLTVFLYALVLSLGTGLLFGTIPAVRASRGNVAEALKQEARTAGRSRRKVTIGNALLVGQVAFSFLLLVTAAVFLRSIGRAYEIDPGFQTAHLATFPANPSQAGYSKAQIRAFYKDVRERVTRIPGIASVSWSSNMPLWARPSGGLEVEGRAQRSQADTARAVVTIVDTAYFETAGVAILSGRPFTSVDQETSTPVAIVNAKMAADYWPGGPLGKRIRLPGEDAMRQIIGVAGSANYSSWGEPPQAAVYVPLEQTESDSVILYARSKGNPRDILQPVENEIHAAGPQILVTNVRTGSEIIDGGLFQARMGVAMLSVFGLLALALASVGLYGILAYSVNRRRREFGVRMALGASQRSVLGLVLREGMSLVMTGVAIGFAASLAIGRLLSGMLYGVNAGDPVSVAGAALVLSAVALMACYVPARWATRVDPITALRDS